MPNIINLAATTALTAVENKMPNVRKTDYKTKISETEKKIIDHDHDKYITVP